MKYNNEQNLPIVGEESSRSKLKEKILKEGDQAEKVSDCPYAEGSTFRMWWMMGYHSGITGTPYYSLKNSASW